MKTFLVAGVASSMLLVTLVGCRRSTEANGAVSQGTPSADAAPAVAPADTPPAKQTPPAAGGDAAAQDTGKAPETAVDQGAPAAAPATPGAEPAGQASGDVVNGWKQYEANCSRCHGQDALGSVLAPDLRARAKVLSRGDFVQIVKKGKVASGMPAFESQLGDPAVDDIYAYVMARSSGKLPPGRPAS